MGFPNGSPQEELAKQLKSTSLGQSGKDSEELAGKDRQQSERSILLWLQCKVD